jgi:hypothetical protein
MNEEPRGGDSTNKTVILVVSIVAGVVLVIVALCGGLAYFGIRALTQGLSGAVASGMAMIEDMQAGIQTAEDFLADLSADKPEAAYARTTKNFQAGQTLQQFKDFVAKYPVLKSHTSNNTNTVNFSPNRHTLQNTLNGPAGSLACTFQLVKEGEQWKVDRFTVP